MFLVAILRALYMECNMPVLLLLLLFHARTEPERTCIQKTDRKQTKEPTYYSNTGLIFSKGEYFWFSSECIVLISAFYFR